VYFLSVPAKDKKEVRFFMEQKKKDRQKTLDNQHATAVTAPDGRYEKTGVAKPDEQHVKEARDWSEEHQQ
jgi:hypothetical protein